MSQDAYGRCPYATSQAALSGKYTMLIMHLLEDGPMRFNGLMRRLPQMTHATLSRQLKRMEADGLVVRTEYAQVPPKVEYSLSEMGERFRPVLDELRRWGMDYIAYLKDAGVIDADGNRMPRE